MIFGILTTNTVEQALDRSGGQDGESVKERLYQRKAGPGGSILKGNVGYTAGLDAMEMANLMRQLSTSALGQNDQSARTVDENA